MDRRIVDMYQLTESAEAENTLLSGGRGRRRHTCSRTKQGAYLLKVNTYVAVLQVRILADTPVALISAYLKDVRMPMSHVS